MHPGEQVRCKIAFQTKGSIYLDSIMALIWAEEKASSGAGSSTSTLTYTLYKDQYLKSYREELEAGRWVTLECPLAIPAYAPTTFTTSNNSISWKVHVKIAYRGWPSWEKSIPIAVSPSKP